MLTHSICVLILAMSGLLAQEANAQVYRYIDANGRVVYSGEKPSSIEAARKITIRDNSVSSMDPFIETKSKDVVMYSASWCTTCKRARAYFDGQGIDYNEYDVDKDPKGKRDFAQLGGRGVPIILVGDQRMNGFSQERFEYLYSADN